jgi:hypothetical protein
MVISKGATSVTVHFSMFRIYMRTWCKRSHLAPIKLPFTRSSIRRGLSPGSSWDFCTGTVLPGTRIDILHLTAYALCIYKDYWMLHKIGQAHIFLFIPTALDPACFRPIPGQLLRWGLLLSSHLDAVELGVSWESHVKRPLIDVNGFVWGCDGEIAWFCLGVRQRNRSAAMMHLADQGICRTMKRVYSFSGLFV